MDRVVRSLKGIKLKKATKVSLCHIIVDIYKCDDKILSKADLIKDKVFKILKKFNLDPKIKTFYQFEPFGVTATVFCEGLQFTIHTWPEHFSGAIDLYSFKGRDLALNVIGELKNIFKSAEYDMKVRKR